jgi:hypothetical protein
MSFGKSVGFITSTATLTTGETEYFMTLILWADSDVDIVPCFDRYLSTPRRPTVFPHGTS